jgi:phosphonate transport system substrate-binding protein
MNTDLGLRITSCQSPLMDKTCRAITGYLGERLALRTTFVDDIPWPERYQRLDDGEIDVAWICGAPYVRRTDQPAAAIDLLAAPVWQGERYSDRPIYFSDVVVHRDSPCHRFGDLQDATWVYNEPGSLTGYVAMRYHLAVQGLGGDFFGRAVESGAHQQALDLILAGEAAVAAIDSTVLSALVARRPEIEPQLRVIDVIGPSPMPPWVVSPRVAPALHSALRHALTTMHKDPVGQSILYAGGMVRLASVSNSDYDPIRTMLQVVAGQIDRARR